MFYCKAITSELDAKATSNRTAALLNDVNFDCKYGMTDDLLRKKLRVDFKMINLEQILTTLQQFYILTNCLWPWQTTLAK